MFTCVYYSEMGLILKLYLYHCLNISSVSSLHSCGHNRRCTFCIIALYLQQVLESQVAEILVP